MTIDRTQRPFGYSNFEHGFSSDVGDFPINNDVPVVHRVGPHPTHFRDVPDYTGRGPKNWQRSDESIMEDVCETLTWHPEIDASEMEVSVDQGVVRLTGFVENRRIKRLTEYVLETLPGVKDIRNELSVNENVFSRARRALMETVDPTGTLARSPSGRVIPRSGDDPSGLRTLPGT